MPVEHHQARDEAVSNGLPWAWVSFALDVVESLVLVQILFFDKPDMGVGFKWGIIEYYFVSTLFMSLGQLAGIALVSKGYYRTRGYCQIFSSVGQVIKLDGVFGVIGGIKALRYDQYLRDQGVEGA